MIIVIRMEVVSPLAQLPLHLLLEDLVQLPLVPVEVVSPLARLPLHLLLEDSVHLPLVLVVSPLGAQQQPHLPLVAASALVPVLNNPFDRVVNLKFNEAFTCCNIRIYSIFFLCCNIRAQK